MRHPATVHPTGFRRHGHYRASAAQGALAPAANAVLLALRWGDPVKVCILERLSAIVVVASAITAQRIDPLSAVIQRSYTANETTGFTSFLPTGTSGRAHVNMNAPQLAQLCLANLAAGISGGTRVADGVSLGVIALPNLTTIGGGNASDADNFLRYGIGASFPTILSTNEGVTVSWGPTALATGTVAITWVVEWSEAS